MVPHPRLAEGQEPPVVQVVGRVRSPVQGALVVIKVAWSRTTFTLRQEVIDSLPTLGVEVIDDPSEYEI